jgi:hypothetical protein
MIEAPISASMRIQAQHGRYLKARARRLMRFYLSPVFGGRSFQQRLSTSVNPFSDFANRFGVVD